MRYSSAVLVVASLNRSPLLCFRTHTSPWRAAARSGPSSFFACALTGRAACKKQALRYLLSMLATQERKAEAISAGAPGPLVHHLTSTDAVVRELSCRSLCALAMLVEGRAAVVAAEGVPAVTKLLADQLPGARTAAAETLAALSAGPEGHVAVLASTSGALQRVVRTPADHLCAGRLRGSLYSNAATNDTRRKARQQSHTDGAVSAARTGQVTMMEDPTSPTSALLAGLVMLSNCTGNDGGIYKALDAHVPSVLLRLAVAEDSGFELQAGCGRVLRNLAQHTYGRVQVIDAGGLNVVAQLLVSNDEELQALGMCVAPACLSRIGSSPFVP